MCNTLKIVYLLMILSVTYSYGQVESWDVYMAQYEKGPGSTVLNMSLKNIVSKKDFPFIVIAEVTFQDCDKDGLPTKNKFATLYTISDTIKAALDRKVKNILAGSFTYQRQRTDYYYVTDTLGIRESLNKLNIGAFKGVTFHLRIREDREWAGYLKFLYPSEAILEYMSDSKVVLALVEKGDKLQKARQVDHWIYFKSEEDRNCFLAYATSHQFKVEAKAKGQAKDKPFSLQISRSDKVSLDEISKITKALRLNAKQCNGDYDGWETFLVTD